MENRKMEQFYFVLDKISIFIVFLFGKLYSFVTFVLYKFYCFSKEKIIFYSKVFFEKHRDIIMEILVIMTAVSYVIFLGFLGIGILYLFGVIYPKISILYGILISYSMTSSFTALIFYIRYKEECKNKNDSL